MIRFSRREDYSVILVNTLVQNYNKRLVPLSEVAKEYSISLLFLRNLAGNLREAGIIKAVEGKNGGYFLAKDPKTLKVGDVLKIFVTKPMFECCTFGQTHTQKKCPKKSFCDPGFVWRKLNQEFIEKIYNMNFEEFVNKRSKDE